MIYCGRLQSPGPALSAKNVLDVPQHASGPFSPVVLASGFSLDLVTNLVLLECLKLPVPFNWLLNPRPLGVVRVLQGLPEGLPMGIPCSELFPATSEQAYIP